MYNFRINDSCSASDLDSETCLDRAHACYWDGARCKEPLLRVRAGGLVLGIDTGSSFTVLTPGVGGCTPHPPGLKAAHGRVLRYGSGAIKVWAVDEDVEGYVPLCSPDLFAQDHDALVGVTPVAPTNSMRAHSWMNSVIKHDSQDQLLVVDKDTMQFCVGKHCKTRKSSDTNIQSAKIRDSVPSFTAADGTHILLDTGSTVVHNDTIHGQDICVVGNDNIRYLEVRPDTVRYELVPGTLGGCAPP